MGFDARRIKNHEAQQILQCFQCILTGMTENPDQRVSQLSLVSAQEQQKVLLLSGSKNTQPKSSKTCIDYFEEQVLKNPSYPALSFQGQCLDYKNLNEQANALGCYLIEQGVGPETPVGVFLPKGLESIISLLAIWKAGAVYIPLDPDYPIERLRVMLEISNIKTLISFSSIFKKMGGKEYFSGDYTLILLDQQKSQIDQCSQNNPEPIYSLQNLAYVLYTSGSTGKPKAVAQEHKTLANLSQWQNKISGPEKTHNITQFAAMSFDVSLQEITYALANGHHLHIVPPHTKQSLSDFYTFLQQEKIDQVFLPTAFLEPFCETGLFKKYCLGYLKNIFVAGEALKISPIIKEFFAYYPQLRLTKQYGPTEAHVVSSYLLAADSATWTCSRSAPIGKPIDHTALYIFDKNQQLLPPGLPGELYIGGIGLARAYLGDPEKTAECFIINPLEKTPYTHLYRTGDKARWGNDGQLEYLGRLDNQIKIRGYRIEPAEIEAKILLQSLVRECRVLAKPDPANTLQLICYCILYANKNSKEKSSIILQKNLSAVLPDYMLPAYYIILEKFPLTQNGKIDEKLLPPPEWQLNHNNSADYGQAKNARHTFDQELSIIWTQILGLEPKNIKNNFFTSGGNSLSALRLILAIEKQFAVQISVNDLFAAPTLEKLSDKIQQLQTKALITHSKTIYYKNQALPFPIIPLQTLGSKKPLFIIHPIGGTIFWFVDLARHLGKERPVYGIQDPGVQDLGAQDLSAINQQKIFSSLEEMAIFYLHCIRQIQPHGPYLIAGSSFGATVAFEIARQLEEQGESADFVGLLDGWAFYPEVTRDQKKFKKLMRSQCEELYQRFQINQLENADRWVNLQWQRSALLWAYTLQPLNAPLTLFKAEELNYAIEWEERDDNYWSNYSNKQLTIIPVPGNHTTIFSELNVQYLAEKINACLD